MDKIRLVAYVDSDMMGDPDDVPRHEAGNTLLVPCLGPDEGTYARALGDEWAPLDAVWTTADSRPRMWALFDREGSDEEKIAALAEYRS